MTPRKKPAVTESFSPAEAEGAVDEIDAEASLSFKVTPSDIHKGDPKNAKRCPIACAIERQYPDVKNTIVLRTVVRLQYADRIVRYRVPISVQKEIVRIDANPDKLMTVGTYTLSPMLPTTKKKHRKRSKPDQVVKKAKRNNEPRTMAGVRTRYNCSGRRGADGN